MEVLGNTKKKPYAVEPLKSESHLRHLQSLCASARHIILWASERENGHCSIHSIETVCAKMHGAGHRESPYIWVATIATFNYCFVKKYQVCHLSSSWSTVRPMCNYKNSMLIVILTLIFLGLRDDPFSKMPARGPKFKPPAPTKKKPHVMSFFC